MKTLKLILMFIIFIEFSKRNGLRKVENNAFTSKFAIAFVQYIPNTAAHHVFIKLALITSVNCPDKNVLLALLNTLPKKNGHTTSAILVVSCISCSQNLLAYSQ